MVYQFDKSYEQVCKDMQGTPDKYELVDILPEDKSRLVSDFGGEYSECTKWLFVQITGDEEGNAGAVLVSVWPVAEDASTPYEEPFTESEDEGEEYDEWMQEAKDGVLTIIPDEDDDDYEDED